MAIKAALIDAGSQFPEIQEIETGQERPANAALYILINAEDIEPVEAGEALKQPVNQKAQVSVLGKVTRDDLKENVKTSVLTAGAKVLQAFKKNMRLCSTVYPDRFLAFNLSFGSIQSDYTMHEKDSVYFQNITIEGGYFL